ncbi:MAG: hypothetical protein HRT52_02965 [Colwellia sp.]|nr:hypothetical protein [Colwellia sp.]
MGYENEFKSVDLLITSDSSTKMVDAFSLSLIKAEKQIRKLFTHLAFQSDNFNSKDSKDMREVLAGFRNVYFDGFIIGINQLSNRTLEEIFGEEYQKAYEKLITATNYRNKIFHGQLTNENLSAQDLNVIVNDIKAWCLQLSKVAKQEFSYCGFARNSFQKSEDDLNNIINIPFNTIEEYRTFIHEYMRR